MIMHLTSHCCRITLSLIEYPSSQLTKIQSQNLSFRLAKSIGYAAALPKPVKKYYSPCFSSTKRLCLWAFWSSFCPYKKLNTILVIVPTKCIHRLQNAISWSSSCRSLGFTKIPKLNPRFRLGSFLNTVLLRIPCYF